VEPLPSAGRALQALLGGSADVAAATFEQLVSLAPEQRNLKSFVTMLIGSTRMLVAGADPVRPIRTVQDLRGRPIGVASPGGPNHMFLNHLLTRRRISPADVSVVALIDRGRRDQ
jgi:NitT/TauT family transport system substrate-binding protein